MNRMIKKIINTRCINHFGGFTCSCLPGYGDRQAGHPLLAGRNCQSCPDEFCSARGELRERGSQRIKESNLWFSGTCSIENGSRVCSCTGNYYGTQCQLDGEVIDNFRDFMFF